MDWDPQAPLTALQACRSVVVCVLYYMFFVFRFVSDQHVYFESYVMIMFFQSPNRRGTQFHVEKLSKFVLNSHIDPIGERNDVR